MLVIFLSFGLGFYWGNKKDGNDSGKKVGSNLNKNFDDKEIRQSGYDFINPLLECEMSGNSLSLKISEAEIKKTIQENIIDKNPDAVISLYYRDLKNGPWFGIDEKGQYSPASLFKVPLMMTYYKHLESNPGFFDREIEFKKPVSNFSQSIVSDKKIEAGKKYKISELIDYMIKYSDNEAADLLFQNIDVGEINSIFGDLGIAAPDLYHSDNKISVKDYASFFRILYNASYLSRNYSEQALKTLSEVEYKDGLIAGIPSGIKVAHKFGERELEDENGKKVRQLHDCGIIYHPQNPYLLCVMTRGKEFKNLSNIISSVSRTIYENVNEN